MSTENISKWLLRVLLGITVIIFALFFLVGFDTPYEEDPKMNAPLLTDAVLYACIGFTIITIILTVWSVVKQLVTGGSTTSKEIGIAAHTGTFSVVVLAVSVIIGLIVGIANKSERLLINGENWNVPGDLITTDTCLISIIILLTIALLCLVVSMIVTAKK